MVIALVHRPAPGVVVEAVDFLADAGSVGHGVESSDSAAAMGCA
jgi:hypothetical protein